MAIINGGLGIKLASFGPFQTESTSNKAKIAYGVTAAIMFILYLFFVIAFEVRRAHRQDEDAQTREQVMANKDSLPSYEESEESVGRRTGYN